MSFQKPVELLPLQDAIPVFQSIIPGDTDKSPRLKSWPNPKRPRNVDGVFQADVDNVMAETGADAVTATLALKEGPDEPGQK